MKNHLVLIFVMLIASISFSQNFSSLEQAMKNPEVVEKLMLRNENFKNFPKEVFKFKNLKYLEFTGSEFTHIPKEIGQLEKLESLYFNKVPIKTIAKDISKLKNLKLLCLTHSTFKVIPDCIYKLNNLKKLTLAFGKFTTIHSKIGEMVSLENLNFEFGELTELPNSLKNLINLKEIWLDVKTDTIPKILFMIPNLRELHLEGTACKHFPISIPLNTSITSINLENSSMESISDIFESLPNLVTFDVAWCRPISNIPPSFFTLKNIQNIYFIQCAIPKKQQNQVKRTFRSAKNIMFNP